MKTKSKSPKKKNDDMEVVKRNETNWDDEARRYIEGVAALLIADSRAGPLLAGTGSGDEVEERVASVLHSLLADRDAWPAAARPLRDHILGSLDAQTALLITKLEAGVGLKRKAAADASKSGARPAKKARKGDEDEEKDEDEEDAFAAFGRSGSQAALSALKQDLDDKARTALYTQLLLAPATAERALSKFTAHSQETSAGLRSCAAITREIHDVMQNEGAHDDAKLSVLKVLAGHMAACDSRRRLASHPSTAPLHDHIKQRRVAHRQRRIAGQWTGRYHVALANLLKEYIKVASLLSSEFAVRKVYPGLLFSVSLASEGDIRLPLALLGALCDLTHSDADADSAAQARLRVVAHKLFYDFFVSEERVLRGNAPTKTKKKSKAAATVQQALSQDPPTHYVRFALMAKRSVEFWGGRKEQQLTQRREEEIKLRKRKDVLATRTTEAGSDLEELRMLEATIDAGYKVAMPPRLKAALAHKLAGKDQFHFRSITEDELLELLAPRSTKTEQNEEDEGENDVVVVGDEDEDEEAENGEEEEEEEEEDTNAEADGGDGEGSAPVFVIDTKGAPTPKHTAKPAAAADKDKAAAPSSLQRDVAALLEQLSEEEEE